MTRIDEIKERLESATPGPWRPGSLTNQSYHGDTGQPFTNIYTDDDRGGKHPTFGTPLPLVVAEAHGEGLPFEEEKANAELIAHAPADIAYLLGIVERLQDELDEWQQAAMMVVLNVDALGPSKDLEVTVRGGKKKVVMKGYPEIHSAINDLKRLVAKERDRREDEREAALAAKEASDGN